MTTITSGRCPNCEEILFDGGYPSDSELPLYCIGCDGQIDVFLEELTSDRLPDMTRKELEAFMRINSIDIEGNSRLRVDDLRMSIIDIVFPSPEVPEETNEEDTQPDTSGESNSEESEDPEEPGEPVSIEDGNLEPTEDPEETS